MVAVSNTSTHSDASVGKGRQLTATEEYFCRLVACEGRKPTQAYRIAWKGHKDSAHDLAPRVMARPHVQAKIAELRARAESEAIMDLRERRKLLADTARSVPANVKASHSDRIAAIREDAILAGERRADGSQVSLTLDISIGAIIGALRGGLTSAHDAITLPPEAVKACTPLPSQEDEPSITRRSMETPGEKSEGVRALAASSLEAPAQAVAGPLGVLRTNGHTNGATNGHKPVNGLQSNGNGHGRGFVVEE